MKVELHYGKGLMALQIPEANVEQIIRPWRGEGKADNIALIQQAMTGRDAETFQEEIAGKRLCVLTSDGSRDMPFDDDIFTQLFSVLQKSSLVRFLICTGSHDAETPESNRIREQIEKAATCAHATAGASRKAGIREFKIHSHDCEQDRFIKAGRTSYGTEVMFNAEADDAEIFLVLSDAKVHYFAGYSNPIKNFVPGICAFKTTEQNHSLALDNKSTFGVHPWHLDESRRSNPVAEDQLEGMRLIARSRPVYALVTISVSRKIQWARFGPAERVSAEAFTIIDERNTHKVRPVGRLVVSPGGLPNDASLYTAQRALEMTKNAVTEGGEILFLAACPNGVGEKQTMENFYERLTAPIDETLKSIESEYKLFSHKAYKFARMIKQLRRIWMCSEIPDELVEAAHLYPAHKPQAVVDSWLAEKPDARITVVDGANRIALYAKTQNP